MEATNGIDIKIHRTVKCLCCKKQKASYEWHRLTHDLVFVIGYRCNCGEETVVRKSIRWV